MDSILLKNKESTTVCKKISIKTVPTEYFTGKYLSS